MDCILWIVHIMDIETCILRHNKKDFCVCFLITCHENIISSVYTNNFLITKRVKKFFGLIDIVNAWNALVMKIYKHH